MALNEFNFGYENTSMNLENSDENNYFLLDEQRGPAYIPEDFIEIDINNFIVEPPERLIINETEEENEAFPFSNGNGLFNLLEKNGFKFEKYYSEKYKKELISFKEKFKTTLYKVGNKNKKRQRKNDKDNIRKKIKGQLHREINHIITENLKKSNCKIYIEDFCTFPQCFLTDVTHDFNRKFFEFTFEELIEKDFLSDLKQDKNPKKDKKQNYITIKNEIEKYKNNKNILNYLNENPEINNVSGFDKIKKMKYVDILKAYFLSGEFENSIINMIKQKEDNYYIEKYVNTALTYVDYYSNN
jgi:hypothetical protein